MISITVMSDLVKLFVVSILTYLIYVKIINTKKQKILMVMVLSIIISIVYVLLKKYMNPLVAICIIYIVYAIIINFLIMNYKINYMAFLISAIISYVLYIISTLISGTIIFAFTTNNTDFMTPISLILIPIIVMTLVHAIFKIKRFKNGFSFVKETKNNKTITIFIMAFTGIVLFFFGLFQRNNSDNVNICLIIGTILTAISFFIWIKSQITKTYKSKMRDRTIEIQKTEIDEKNKILEEVKEENLKFAKTIHKYNKKLSALEFEIKSKLEQETNTEFASELAIILKETKETAENFAKETEIKSNKLPETNIPGIDTMLKYMQEEARAKNINLDVKLNASINSLLENIISKDKFETLIGDHLKDAIIAVEASKNSYKSILVTIGLVEGIYEFSVYDTGIEFEIETLLKLGEEQVTTHKETGGSGIGFMTTFETLKECRASLVIEEYNPETTSYTKCITIRFDGKNKYKIYSYRANKLKEQKHKRKITIEELR